MTDNELNNLILLGGLIIIISSIFIVNYLDKMSKRKIVENKKKKLEESRKRVNKQKTKEADKFKTKK